MQVEIYMERVRLATDNLSYLLCVLTKTYKSHLCSLYIVITIRSVSCRDLFDLSKDNIQIKEQKGHGILLCGVTEVILSFFHMESFQFTQFLISELISLLRNPSFLNKLVK